MKQVIIVIILTITLIIVSLFVNNYLELTSQNLFYYVNNIETYVRQENWNKANNEFLLANKAWNEMKNKWAIFIEHKEINNIEISINKIEKYMESKSIKDVLAEISKFKLLIKHISNTYKLSLENIL